MQLRRMIGVALFWLAGSAVPLHAEQHYPESIGVGEVVELDLAAGTVIIEGYRYRYAPDIPVQVGGSPTDMSMLAPGMQIQFRFLRVPNDLREVVEIRQIPPGVTIQRL